MKFDDIVELGFDAWRSGVVATPFCLLGRPGIGKSSVAPEIARRMTEFVSSRKADAPAAVCEIVDLSSRMPEDIGGIPYRGTMTADGRELVVAEYGTQKWLARMCMPGVYGVLLLDDLPAAAPAVQVATRQLALDRRVGDAVLSDGVLVMLTGNRREDKSGATTLPAHFRNSVCLLDLDTDVESWVKWYGSQADHAPVVSAFLQFKPSLHSTLPKDADPRGAFATPRTWAKLGRLYDVASRTGNLMEVASGLVGEGAATEFLAYVNVRSQLVDPAEVLLDPEKALPNPTSQLRSPDRMHAMTTGIAEVAATWAKDGANAQRAGQAPFLFMRALGWVTQDQKEYVATGVNTFIAQGVSIRLLTQAASSPQGKKDPSVQKVIQFLRDVYRH